MVMAKCGIPLRKFLEIITFHFFHFAVVMSNVAIKDTIKKHTVGPIAPGHHDLSHTHLTLFENYWLGSRIVYRVSTAANLRKRFSLSAATFKKYAYAL